MSFLERSEWRTRWDMTIPHEKRKLIDRVQRRFRGHVRTRTNPKGRIHREPCQFCGEEKSEAHHIDYSRTFYVTWACESCHRKIEHGSLTVTARKIFNYESLVITRKGGWFEQRGPEAPGVDGVGSGDVEEERCPGGDACEDGSQANDADDSIPF